MADGCCSARRVLRPIALVLAGSLPIHGQAEETAATELTEVVVTAERRSERLPLALVAMLPLDLRLAASAGSEGYWPGIPLAVTE